MNISNKFEFDTQNEKCRYWTKSGEKKEVPQVLKSEGMFNYQKVFQLEREHKECWINYSLRYSRGKTWLRTWYKKRIVDNSETDGVKFVHYQKKVEKTTDLIIIEFTEQDEMIKVFDEEKQKHKYINKLKLKSEES